MERIERLRKEALSPVIDQDEFFYRFFSSYETNGIACEWEKYADAFYRAFSTLTPSIWEDELVVGKYENKLSESERREWEETYQQIALDKRKSIGSGQDSHMAVDYEHILECGLLGIIAQIDGYLSKCEPEKIGFYKACRRSLEAIIAYSESYSREALRLAGECTDAKRRAELEALADICKNVPANPAGSFWEAVQCVNFITHCISVKPFNYGWQLFQLGHPDRYLLPYYEKDIASGTLTKEFAQLLLDCLGIQFNMRLPNGLACGYMVGGRDTDGNIVQNELTEMCMRVVDDIKLVYPGVGLCYTDGMDDKYLDIACDILSRGRSHPAIFNDDIITAGLMHYGMPEAEAHNYIHSTCVEITPVASSNVWVASPYINTPMLLLQTLERDFDSFDTLLAAYFERLDSHLGECFEYQNEQRKIRAATSVNPLVSCFVNDCLERGVDIDSGGAKYNWIMPSFVGIANLVDSLFAIKMLVYDKKELTLAELRDALSSNFENAEKLRLHILRDIPKYGNDIDCVDEYFSVITRHIVEECRKYTAVHSNGNIIPSAFCWVMHELHGRRIGATPDGRKAGFPLGDGSGPCQGREMNGPTASILSSTKWSHKEFIGGTAVNMKFSKSSLGANAVETMKNLVKVFMQRGGFEIQINVIDKETLMAARENPEAYNDLIVRIGGYSDYFTKLSSQMQDEVILRTEHRI